MTHVNASAAQHDYNAAGRLTALCSVKSDGSAISIFVYSYNSRKLMSWLLNPLENG